VRSWTTGARQAVLSKHSSVEQWPVAALSIPMRSLIAPVIPPDFGFVVIDADGKVQFHSDPEHNLSEGLFVQCDASRRLRALTAGRGVESVNIASGGDDQRAFVKLFNPDPQLFDRQWTIVTFYDKGLLRTVRTEWLVHTILCLLIYLSVYVVICVAVRIGLPRYRAPWLWPDPTRSVAYLDLLPPLLLV